jgi:putative endonuclease
MKSQNKVTGNRGEGLAAEYLMKKDYEILERNFRTRFGEIDIVGYDGETLVFVEVKTKIGHDFGEPEEMVNKTKLAQVQRMGQIYIDSRFRGNDKEVWKGLCRVDVVAVVLEPDGAIERIEHYEAVY